MGKLIEGAPFGKKITLKTTTTESGGKVIPIRINKEKEVPVNKNKEMQARPELAEKAMKLAIKIQFFLSRLGLAIPGNQVLVDAEKYWKIKNIDQLIEAAESSNKKDWSKYPGRYSELVRALRRKVYEIYH